MASDLWITSTLLVNTGLAVLKFFKVVFENS